MSKAAAELKVIAPGLGDGIEKAVVACWHKSPGDKVSAEDDLAELVTDKAVFNIPAGAEGTVQEICFQAGQQVQIGDTLAIIKTDHD